MASNTPFNFTISEITVVEEGESTTSVITNPSWFYSTAATSVALVTTAPGTLVAVGMWLITHQGSGGVGAKYNPINGPDLQRSTLLLSIASLLAFPVYVAIETHSGWIAMPLTWIAVWACLAYAFYMNWLPGEIWTTYMAALAVMVGIYNTLMVVTCTAGTCSYIWMPCVSAVCAAKFISIVLWMQLRGDSTHVKTRWRAPLLSCVLAVVLTTCITIPMVLVLQQ